eukprot:8623654-Ditylum_brightwellii.AAC.1
MRRAKYLMSVPTREDPCLSSEDDQVGMVALRQVDGSVGIGRVADGAGDGLGVVIKEGHTGVLKNRKGDGKQERDLKGTSWCSLDQK